MNELGPSAADLAADIFEALGTMRLAGQVEGDSRVSFRSADAIRAARWRLPDDGRRMFETEDEFGDAAVEHVLGELHEVSLPANVRKRIAEALDVAPEAVGRLPEPRRPKAGPLAEMAQASAAQDAPTGATG